MRWLVVPAALAMGACAFTPIVPSRPPEGRGWRTQHQRYVVTEAQSTSQQLGNTTQITTSVETRQKVIVEAVEAPPEVQVLHEGMIATPEWFAPEGAAKKRKVSR